MSGSWGLKFPSFILDKEKGMGVIPSSEALLGGSEDLRGFYSFPPLFFTNLSE